MTLTELRYAIALGETGVFRKAAEHCNVSQPTLARVNTTPIGQRFIVLLPTQHPLAIEKAISPASLADHKGQAMLEGGSLETIKHMVASGLGITVLPRSAAQMLQVIDLLTDAIGG